MTHRQVVEAKDLLDGAKEWGMFTWMSQSNKDRVRSAIDGSTEILRQEVVKVKKSWSAPLRNAYNGRNGDPKTRRAVRKLLDAEEALAQVTAQCKTTFDEAERELNAGKARQGAVQARQAIEIHETVLELARWMAGQSL